MPLGFLVVKSKLAVPDKNGGRARERLNPYWVVTGVSLFFMVASRWGAHVGIPGLPIFVGDAGFLVALVLALTPRHGRRLLAFRPKGSLVPILIAVVWFGLRFLVGDWSATAARDAAPFAYSLLAVLTAAYFSYQRQAIVLRWLKVGLFVHASWVAVAIIFPGVSSAIPVGSGRVHIFEIRADFDGLLIALLACMAIGPVAGACKDMGFGRWGLLIGACSIGLMGVLGSRAAVIGLLGGAALILFLGSAVGGNQSRRQIFVLCLASGMALLVLSATGSMPVAFERSVRTVSPDFTSRENAEATATALGTVTARQRAWARVIDHSTSAPQRLWLGSGFGPDFLAESGASKYYEGVHTEVRSPHNFLLTVLARTGVIGLALFGWVAFQAVSDVRHLRRRSEPSPLGQVAALLVTMTLLVSLVGVVLESPFGAIPFYWAVGVLVATVCGETRIRPRVRNV